MPTTSPSRAICLALVAAWLLVQIGYTRPPRLVESWNSWRQADTQTIALFFLEDFDLFRPRVAWGGDGPGYVEAELQIYTAMIAGIMVLSGKDEWPGQVLSSVFMALAALVLFRFLQLPFGHFAALVGVGLFLSSPLIVALGVSVMPEALCVLFYVLSLHFLRKHMQEGSGSALVAMMLTTALAALVKPTALHLGIVQFVALFFGSRDRLNNWRIWAGWGIVLGLVGWYLLFAHSIFLQWGNSFGVLGAPDSKFPGLEHLLMPGMYLALLEVSLKWGLGYVGFAAACYLVIRRRLGAFEWGLVVGNALSLVVSLRYSSAAWMGGHYHLFSTVVLAVLAAKMVKDLRMLRPASVKAIAVAAILLCTGRLGWALERYKNDSIYEADSSIVECADVMALFAAPGSLAIVRSSASSWDEFWDRQNNYQDPRVFYVAGLRGWSLPSDEEGVGELASWLQRGARFYVEPMRRARSVALERWLDQKPYEEIRCGEGAAFRLAG